MIKKFKKNMNVLRLDYLLTLFTSGHILFSAESS